MHARVLCHTDEVVESELYRERQLSLTPGQRNWITFAEWVITFLIGFFTGFTVRRDGRPDPHTHARANCAPEHIPS